MVKRQVGRAIFRHVKVAEGFTKKTVYLRATLESRAEYFPIAREHADAGFEVIATKWREQVSTRVSNIERQCQSLVLQNQSWSRSGTCFFLTSGWAWDGILRSQHLVPTET